MKKFWNAVWATIVVQIKYSFARPMYKFVLFLAPMFYSIITYTLFSHSGQENFASYAILGTGLLSLWDSICFSSASDIERERWAGTLQAIYNTPTRFKIIVIGKVVGNTFLGLIPFMVSFFVIRFGYGAKMYISSVPQFCAAFLISVLSFMGVAYFFSVIFTLSRSASILTNFLGAPIHILCGILFPVTMLPGWIRPISYTLPPTWAAELLRMCIDGIGDWKVFFLYCAVLTAETVIFATVSSFLFDLVDKKVRIDASITIN